MLPQTSSEEEELVVMRNVKNMCNRRSSPKIKKKKEAEKTVEEKCYKCGKILRPTNKFGCRCGNVFCMVHRFSDQHNCSFNFKAFSVKKLRQENPQVINKKVTEF
ncbi:hypothetical protein H311_04546 [Anncaliia algerae PRA109]|nr:hypothetical protein H311_04546 [Anncaliia algerae PRA109]